MDSAAAVPTPAPKPPAAGLRIGGVALDGNLLLCPIAGYCDLSYRLIVRSIGGLALAYTDLVNPRGLMRQTSRSMQIVQTTPEDDPLSIQLYGSDAGELADAAVWAAERGSKVVDLNMGCPVPKVAGNGGGSGLLRNCPNAVALAAAVAKACPVPVTVKTRLGWEMGNLVAPDLVRRLEDVGVAAVTIHGRYGEQRFSGSVDLAGIRAVVAAARTIPVIGNGDVRSPRDVKHMFEETGCAGVMIGRRALADPWIFQAARAYLTDGVTPPGPDRLERTRKMIDHFENLLKFVGERTAVVQFRKRMTWYSKTIGPCPKLRRGVPLMQSSQEFYDLVGEFLDEILQGGPGLGLNAPSEAENESEEPATEEAYSG
ncbi:MAG: tRNA dihydrouridine synthase DusB [Planctomycetia bacterium]